MINTYKEVMDSEGNVTLEKCYNYEGFKEDRWQIVDIIGDVKVSTVFLSLDHGWINNSEPIVYETMVFGGSLDSEQNRYSTRANAIIGHNEMVKRVRDAQ